MLESCYGDEFLFSGREVTRQFPLLSDVDIDRLIQNTTNYIHTVFEMMYVQRINCESSDNVYSSSIILSA